MTHAAARQQLVERFGPVDRGVELVGPVPDGPRGDEGLVGDRGVGAPVAATRAISTQNNARAMMAPPKKEGMNVPLVLAVTAGVLALGVVATLIIGAVAGLF